MSEEIKKILVKFLMNSANSEELDTLTNWLKKSENKKIFKSYIRIDYVVDENLNEEEFNTLKAKEKFLHKVRKDEKANFRLKFLKYAAAAVLFLSFAYFLRQKTGANEITNDSKIEAPIIVNNEIETGTNKATLTLESGDQVELEKGKLYQSTNLSSDGEKVIYNSDNSEQVVYNY